MNEFPQFVGFPDSALCQTLLGFKGRRITCLMNEGNCGDGLIHIGGRRLLRKLGLEWEEINERKPASGDVLLAYGAGNLCRKAWGMAFLLKRYIGSFRQIVILPATIDVGCRRVVDMMRMLPENAVIFCRCAKSYRDTRHLFPNANIQLSHDLAFCANLSAWADAPHSGATSIYREDEERRATRKPLVGDVFDASLGTEEEPEKLLDHVSRYSVVHTDRTHGAISAAMMGREVHFYPNAYFKNRAIYTHSLRHFPNVTWEEAPVDIPALIKARAFKAYQALRSIDRNLRAKTGILPPRPAAVPGRAHGVVDNN